MPTDMAAEHASSLRGDWLSADGVARNRKFESSSLQRKVRLSPGAAFEGREPPLSARLCATGLATGSTETRSWVKITPSGGNTSVAPYSNTAVPLMGSARMPRRYQ